MSAPRRLESVWATDQQAQRHRLAGRYTTASTEHPAKMPLALAAHAIAAYSINRQGGECDLPATAPGRVRTDTIAKAGSVTLRHNGKLHHIGIGRIHARTRVILIVEGLDIRVINATTGELLRALTLDPTRDY